MGCQNRYGTIAVGVYGSHQPGTVRPMTEQWTQPRFNWEAREPKTWRDPNRWFSLWSFGCRIGCADANMDGAPPINHTITSPDLYEPYSCDGPGSQNVNFLRGSCVDAVGTPVANAIVQAFVTATDAYLGEMQGHTDGSYAVGVQTAKTTPCYLVAYKAGSPDIAGTTVNTLLPTNVDGS